MLSPFYSRIIHDILKNVNRFRRIFHNYGIIAVLEEYSKVCNGQQKSVCAKISYFSTEVVKFHPYCDRYYGEVLCSNTLKAS